MYKRLAPLAITPIKSQLLQPHPRPRLRAKPTEPLGSYGLLLG